MSAAKLAAFSGVSEKAIRDIENGKRPGSAVTWGKIIIGLNKNPEKSRVWQLSDFSQAKGEALYDATTRPSAPLVKETAMIDEAIRPDVPTYSFWESKTVEELAAEQGVQPITDFDKLAGGWPEDEDIEEFLEAIRSLRGD